MVVLYGNVLAALGFDRFCRLPGFISGDFLHIADAGRIVVLGIGILLAVDAASDVGDLLGSAVDALIRNGNITDFHLVGFYSIVVDGCIPSFKAALFAQVHILAQGHVVIGLTVGGMPLQFQVAAFDQGIISVSFIVPYGNGGVFLC